MLHIHVTVIRINSYFGIKIFTISKNVINSIVKFVSYILFVDIINLLDFGNEYSCLVGDVFNGLLNISSAVEIVTDILFL